MSAASESSEPQQLDAPAPGTAPPIPPAREPIVGPLEAAVRHPVLVLLPIVALLALAIAAGLNRTEELESTARISVGRTDVPAFSLQTVVQGNSSLANNYSQAIAAPDVAREAARLAGVSPAVASGALDATPVAGTTLIEIRARSTEGKRKTIALANAGARALIGYVVKLQTEQDASGLEAEYRSVRERVDRARIRVARLERASRRTPDVRNRELEAARISLEVVRTRAESLRTQLAQVGAAPAVASTLQLIVPADKTSGDRLSTTGQLAAVGLAGGVISGLALALLVANFAARRRRRRV